MLVGIPLAGIATLPLIPSKIVECDIFVTKLCGLRAFAGQLRASVGVTSDRPAPRQTPVQVSAAAGLSSTKPLRRRSAPSKRRNRFSRFQNDGRGGITNIVATLLLDPAIVLHRPDDTRFGTRPVSRMAFPGHPTSWNCRCGLRPTAPHVATEFASSPAATPRPSRTSVRRRRRRMR